MKQVTLTSVISADAGPMSRKMEIEEAVTLTLSVV